MKPRLNMKPAHYIAMEQWHRSVGSNSYFIEYLQRRAANAGAPLDALFYDNNEMTWKTVRDLPADHPFRRSWEKQ